MTARIFSALSGQSPAASRMPFVARTLVHGTDCMVVLCTVSKRPSCIIVDRDMVYDTPPRVCELPSSVWMAAQRMLNGTVLLARRLERPSDPRDHRTHPVTLVVHDLAVVAGYTLVGAEPAPLAVRMRMLSDVMADVSTMMHGIVVEAAPFIITHDMNAAETLARTHSGAPVEGLLLAPVLNLLSHDTRRYTDGDAADGAPHDLLADVLEWHRHEAVTLLAMDGAWFVAANRGGSLQRLPPSVSEVRLYDAPPDAVPAQGACMRCFLTSQRGLGPLSAPTVVALAYGLTSDAPSTEDAVAAAINRMASSVRFPELHAWMTGVGAGTGPGAATSGGGADTADDAVPQDGVRVFMDVG